MKFNVEKLAQIAEQRSEAAKKNAEIRKEKREWMRMSQEIALGMHYYLRISKMTQKEFAEKMCVSPAYVGKLLKGTENLTLDTICKIHKAMGEILVSVTKPYICRSNVSIVHPSQKFSNKAISSDKYRGSQIDGNKYITCSGIPA